MSMLLTSAWRDWYKAQHMLRSQELATAFESYMTDVLSQFHDDFVNPDPIGSLGDGGCDGLADAGRIAYACFGSTTERDAERRLENKVKKDFKRATEKWTSFSTWRFVTNSPFGPLSSQAIIDLQKLHEEGTERPIRVRLWTPKHVWSKVVVNLPFEKLDLLYPGCPGAVNVELIDLIPLLDSLRNITAAREEALPVRPVPIDKMDFNAIPDLKRMELNQWRHLAGRIDDWFDGSGDPDLRDHEGVRFRRIYEESRNVDGDSAAILERIYVSLGGRDFRFDSKRANAVYAVTSYFFDLCHIFEVPQEGREPRAPAN
jgi:hypothetical protein